MPFRRVVDAEAGPGALGILVPPGSRTLVILRPRAVPWDLLTMRADTGRRSVFCDFGREEAAGVARKVLSALEQMAAAGRHPLEIMARPGATGFEVRARVADLCWVVCSRIPSEPYEPAIFPAREEAQSTLMSLAPMLCPPADACQEYYFNTQNFAGDAGFQS